MTSPVTAQLILIQGDASNNFQQVIELHDRNQTIGRAQTSDIIWSSLQISRRHATLEYRSQKWFIVDLSTNGLTVNSLKLTKGEPRMLKDADIISFIPTGAVRYRFRYCTPASPIALPLPSSRPQASTISSVNIAIPSSSSALERHESNSRASVELVDDDSRSDSEESNRSESLLSVDPPDADEEFLSFSGDEQSPGFSFKRKHRIESSDSDAAVDKKKKRVLNLNFDSSSSDDDDSHPCASSSCKSKSAGTAPSSSSASKLKSLHNWLMTDVEISNCEDVKTLQQQLRICSTKLSKTEVELKALQCERDMEREDFRRRENNVKSVNAAFKEETYKKVLELMESELSCSVCNEIFIQATVVDCGHTFCSFCINEWGRKKAECPICRKAFRNKSRHIEMENYITRIFDSLSSEISAKRKTSIKEREEQAKKAAAEAAQQAAPGPRQANAYNVMQTTGRYIDFLAELHQINEILAPRPGRANSRRRSARIQDRDPAVANPAPPADGGAPRGRRRGRTNAVAAAAPAPPVVVPPHTRAQANPRQNPIPVVTLNDTQHDEGAGRLPFSNNANHNINQFINPLNWFGY